MQQKLMKIMTEKEKEIIKKTLIELGAESSNIDQLILNDADSY